MSRPTSAEFRAALQNSLVFNDGIGVDIASRLLYGSPFPENLNGTDFGPNYLRATRTSLSDLHAGGDAGTAERAAQRLASICPQHEFVGCHHGHFDAEQVPELIDRIRRSKADVLLVAMGNPKQELFIQQAPGRDRLHPRHWRGGLVRFPCRQCAAGDALGATMAARMALSSGAGATPPRAPLPGRHSVVLDAHRQSILVGGAG